ncbi:GyrI-like domain-containing protein [Sporosarcina highlanderae]|uniref:GyrI-like domain-containing protein n=1 Tax=Sporosarcina highlanderae TaxID=3035916 RepID=A0ABT8JMU1_9BACL|nr:GyrI-like domain-containing protein [Sporosarcina highlanderae]MDN4606460.1 GyrI-like domain-containing protein [Sporosarcina highlanderae]
MLSIGKTAYLVGLTVKAIKHYEEIGLIQPAYVNPESGYRFYSQKEQQQLIRIRTMRSFGVSLSDILREGDEQMDRLLLHRKREIEQEINELQGKMEGIDQLLNKGENDMETRIVESERFTVKGYEVVGPVSAIPAEWDRLIKEINENDVVVEESFGVCLKMENDIIHYIAGLKSELTEGFPDTKEVIIPAGKFIVATVEGGIPGIPAAYDYIIQMEDIKLRDCYDFERYVHPAGVSEDVIEIWMPIE